MDLETLAESYFDAAEELNTQDNHKKYSNKFILVSTLSWTNIKSILKIIIMDMKIDWHYYEKIKKRKKKFNKIM